MSKLITEGGNVTAKIKQTGEETSAEKIDLKGIGRKEFMQKFVKLFKTLNQRFKREYGKFIWNDESLLTSGFAFNGSTSYIMNPDLSDEEVVKYKPSAGDLDIAVDVSLKEDLFNFLDSLEGAEIIPGAKYMGSNKPTLSSIGDQINSVILIEFSNGIRVPAQVDFEFLEFKGDKPTEWAKFSHSSSFEDAKAETTTGVRGVVKAWTDGKRYFEDEQGSVEIDRDLIIAVLKD